mgnify:CR=1 FL=1
MSREIFEKNLSAMDKWYPEFVKLIREIKDTEDDTEVFTEMSDDGDIIFRIKKENRILYLGGRRNAKSPVEMWIERLGKIHEYSPVFLFGIGNGAYVRKLIENTKDNVYVVVYEPSINIFLNFLKKIDFEDVIKNRPIAFIIDGINDVEFGPVMNKVLAIQNMEFLKEEIHPNYQAFYADKIIEKIKIIDKQITAIRIQFISGKRFQKNMAENIFSNMKYVCEGYHTKLMAEKFPPDSVAILVSAGPSLNKNMHELKKAKNKAFILAVDTAVKPLLKNGIVPDAFVTIDPDKPLELIEIEGAEKIPVIAPATAKYTLLEHQKAKKIFYYDGYNIPAHIYWMNGKELPDASSGGSVACSGFSLLYKMGFKTIILVGQDLAYTGNKSYVDGAFQDEMPEEDTSGMIMVKGNYEDKVPTELIMKVYLEWFEMYIEGAKKHQDVRIVNATEGGAFIKGTELAELHEIIEESCLKEVNYTEIIDSMEPDLTDDEKKKAVEYLQSIPEQLHEMKENAEQMQITYKKLMKVSKSGNLSEKNCKKHLKKIKKLTKKIQEKRTLYQLIDITMSPAEFVVLSEYYYEDKNKTKDMQEVVRKGTLYSEMLSMCIGLLEEIAEELLFGTEERKADKSIG